MNELWWYVSDNQKIGPVTEGDIHQLFTTKQIVLQTLVWQQGMANWVPLVDVEELNNTLAFDAPPPIPTQTLNSPPLPLVVNQLPVMIGSDRVLQHLHLNTSSNNSITLIEAGRWRRFFARLLDVWLSLFLAYTPLITIVNMLDFVTKWLSYDPSRWVIIGILVLGLAFVFDAIIYKVFGNTLGKALFRISVLHDNGDRLTFKEYLSRNNLVWGKGFALGIPPLNILTFFVQFFRIGKGNKANYDENTDYVVVKDENTDYVFVKTINWVLLPMFGVIVLKVLMLSWHPQSGVATPNLETARSAYKDGDYETALKHLTPFAEQGNPEAQSNLGIMYDRGEGVAKDAKQAVNWYRKAAEQGYVEAQFNLGWMYDNGEGVAKDAKQAVEWYRKAAEQGDARAQTNLGVIYYKGEGFAKDWVIAYHWFNLAAMSTDPSMIEKRDILETLLTPAQLAQGQAMTREYLANEEKPKTNNIQEQGLKERGSGITGTAFLINKQGYLLTNAHVVNQCKTIKVYSENTTTLATIVARDEKNDMAIIKTYVWSYAKPMQFSKQTIALGQDIYAIGYPLPTLLALDLQMTKGNISALAGLGNDSRYYQISAPVQSGNSGSPLVNGYGLVSGMVTSKANIVKINKLTGDYPQNVNFALKESQLKNYLDAKHIEYEISSNDNELKGEQIAAQARKYTVLLECVQ